MNDETKDGARESSDVQREARPNDEFVSRASLSDAVETAWFQATGLPIRLECLHAILGEVHKRRVATPVVIGLSSELLAALTDLEVVVSLDFSANREDRLREAAARARTLIARAEGRS